MIRKRPANTRGFAELAGKIQSHRTFTFEGYQDWRYMNYSSLETINDDRVQSGFHTPRHIHTNREIFGYVIEGPCYHTDEYGNQLEIPSGAVQRMCSGRGLIHTEGNASDHPIRYLQLWIRSEQKNYQPEYAWHQFTREDKLNRFCDITAMLPIRANARLLAGIFEQDYRYQLKPNRRYYLYMVLGAASINNYESVEGDGYAIEQETELCITNSKAEIILFDLP